MRRTQPIDVEEGRFCPVCDNCYWTRRETQLTCTQCCYVYDEQDDED